jgi:hypothetical protein
MQGEARCPSASAEGCGVQPAVAQVLSLLQPPVGGCAVPGPRAPKAQRRCRSARRAAARAGHVCPAEHGREHLRDGPDRAGRHALPRKPRRKRPGIRRESDRMPRACGTRSRPSLRAIRTSAPAVKGARSAAVAAAAYVPSSRTIASDPSPVVRHANDTAQDATASRLGSLGIRAAIERPLGGGGAYPVRAVARCSPGRPLACSRSGNHRFGS